MQTTFVNVHVRLVLHDDGHQTLHKVHSLLVQLTAPQHVAAVHHLGIAPLDPVVVVEAAEGDARDVEVVVFLDKSDPFVQVPGAPALEDVFVK